jgi:tape measure domain-containing protein
MVKTLGIKFEVAGVKEATASLNSLRSGLDSALNQNKVAIESYQRDVKRGWNNWKIENFGTITQKQNLILRTERQEFSQRSTYKQLERNDRALVLEFRLAYKEFFTQLQTVFEELKPDKPGILGNIGNFLGGALKFGFDALLFPFQAAVSGLFERLGEVQVQDFAEGFNANLQRALGLSFKETGGDVGNVIGKSLYKVYQKSVDSVDQYVKGTLQFNLADTLIDAFKYTVNTLAKELPALALRTHRRIQINKSAIPEARRAAGQRIIDDDLPEATKKDIEQNKSITLVYGGANTDKADIGKDYTARVMKPYLKGSAVIPLTRQWTNSAVDSQFQGDIRNLIKLVLSNQVTANTFKGFIAENGLNDLAKREQAELMDGLDLGGGEIDLTSLDRIAELVESLIENKDFALGKALQATFKGYNPDDVLGAAEAIALMQKYPDKDLQIGGFSHGGYNALGTVDLLNRMGYDQVKGFSIGTPITGANATVNPDNFRAFMGDKDYYYKALTGLAGDNIDFPEFFELGENEGSLHSLQGYVRGDNLKGGLQAFLGDRISLPSNDKYGKHDSAYGYSVGELGAETALIRTLMTYLGENQLGAINAKEGFVFSAEETLPGYVTNLKKLGQGLKDEDTKKFHVEYIDFLETLQQELEIAEQLAAIGQQYKPVASLQKAAKIFPQMEKLAAKHTTQGMSDEQLEAAQLEAQEKEKYVFFQRKVKQQKDNIERTFQAMLGRKFTAKDESKGIYSFYNPDEYDQRAGNFEGMVNWLENDILGGASDGEKEQAQPTLDLLKKITQSIRETGSTGQFDLSTARSAEELLGIDLKEFDLLFQEFERNNKQKIDVNQYKDELRTFRRNREQLLNEKIIPNKIDQSLDSARSKLNTVSTEINKPVLNTQQLQSLFSDYLAEIIRKGTEYGTNFLKDNANQIKTENFNEAEVTRSFNELNTQFKSATYEYRKAVADGNNELATQLAEDLLFQSGSLKRIYGELLGQIQNEDTAKSIRGFSGYLTSVQTEITQGQPNLKGRAKRGLPDLIADNPAFEDQVRKINFGTDIRAGVEKIINRETGEEIGYQFVLGINQGGQSAADINSPSRVWQWIGEMIKKGFEAGVENIGKPLTDAVSNMATELDNHPGLLDPLLETEGADRAVNDFFGDIFNKVSTFFDDFKEKYPILGRVSEALMSIGGELLQVLGIFSLGEAIFSFGSQALATAMQMESLEKSIVAVSKSAEDGAKNIAFVKKEAKDLSIDLVTAADGYKRLLGATRNTTLEGLQTDQLFSTLATTAKNRGLTTDATNRLFIGFEQIIGKNEFRSEEVKGQIGDVMGDMENMLATAVGINRAQLPDMMKDGMLKVPDVMPKLTALMDAKNAAVGDSSGTAASAQIRLNNAILEYQDAVGKQLQPVQKMGLNALSSVLEVLRDRSMVLIKLFNSLAATVLLNLTLKLVATKFAVNGLITVMQQLLGVLTSAHFLTFAARFLLVSAAIEVWSNNIKLARNAFPDLKEDIEASSKALDALRSAFDGAGEAASNYGSNQSNQLQLNEGAKIPEWLQGVVGGERLNLDNLVRNRINSLGGQYGKYQQFVFDKTGQNLKAEGFGITTQAQKKQADFVVGAGDLISNSDQTLTYGNQARTVLSEIAKIDEEARKLQSQRLSITSGDTAKLKEATDAEAKVFKQRDELLKKSAQYQQSLQSQIEKIKPRLEELDQLDKTGGNKEEIAQRKATRASLLDRLGLLEDEKKAIDEINSRIPKFLSELERILQNTDLSVKGFIGNQEDNAVVNRTEAIKTALSDGLSDAQLEIKLDDLAGKDFEERINFLNQKIGNLQNKLGSGSVQEGVKLLEQAAAKDGLELTPDVLQKMLTDGRSANENQAAKTLLALDEYQGLVDQSQAGLVDLIKSNKSKLQDLTRTIEDYFFRINQQIKEAEIEVLKIVNQIVQTNIKNKLQAAISPNAESFVNNLISSTQSLLDQTASYAEKVLGQRGARIQFAGQKRTLEMELQDFARNVSGASEALAVFESRLRGDGLSNGSGGGDFASKTKDIANRLGIDPQALMTIMLFESAGTLDPKIQGANVPGQGKGRGLIQFMPNTARGLGTSDDALARMSDVEQLDWVEKYFAQFKGDFGAGKLENLYAAVLAGDPKAVNASDGYTTARLGAQKMRGQYGAKAAQLLASGGTNSNLLAVPAAPNFNSTGSLPAPPDIEIKQATQDTEFLINKEEQKLDLQDSLINNQEKESLDIAIANTFASIRRQVDNEIKERQFQLDDSIFAELDLLANYDYQTADTQAAQQVRGVNKAFSDRAREIAKQLQFYNDEIDSIRKLIADTPSLIAQAKTDEERQVIYEQEANAKLLLPVYQEGATQLTGQLGGLNAQAENALYFVREQNKLKIEQEKLSKDNTILEQQANLAAQRGTLEERRQLKLKQEEQRLELAINQIRLNTPEGVQRNEEILGELRQSKLNKENIDYDSQLEELDIERKLLDYQVAIADKKAGSKSRFGLNFGAEKLKKESAIAQEKLRFERELIELEKQYKGDPKVLEEMSLAARELNAVNLQGINQQFKTLSQTVQDSFVSATGGFFTNFTTNFFDGKAERDRAALEERLRYAEEVVALENQYREEPGKLAHLKNRARELNEQKLNNVTQEFSLFGRAVDIAKQALLEFIKQLAQMAAQQAASKAISAILNIASGGFGGGAKKAGINLGKGAGASAIKAFKADKGATVGDRKLSPGLTNWLRNNSPDVASAWAAEGADAHLGVFHSNEELLSRKTGEAGRYQALKARYGINPLDKIQIFANGGTVGDNILASFPTKPKPTLDLANLGNPDRSMNNRNFTLNQTIVSPNADSFRLNADQRNQDLLEQMRRGI